MLPREHLPKRDKVIAESEQYEQIIKEWVKKKPLYEQYIKRYTEKYPP